MGVTPQVWAISAMVNWRALYMRWAFAVRGAQGVELQLGVLVCGGHPCVSDSGAHGHAHYRNPLSRGGSVGSPPLTVVQLVSGETGAAGLYERRRWKRIARLRSSRSRPGA